MGNPLAPPIYPVGGGLDPISAARYAASVAILFAYQMVYMLNKTPSTPLGYSIEVPNTCVCEMGQFPASFYHFVVILIPNFS